MFKKKKKNEAAESTEAGEEKEVANAAKSTNEGEGGEGAEGEAAPKKGKKKLLFIIGGLVAALAIGGGLFFAGIIGGKKSDTEAVAEGEAGEHGEAKEGEHGEGAAVIHAPVYYELPQFLVNLNSTTSRVSFLKMSVTLELRDAEAVKIIDANKPRVQDTFNTYLRELRAPDLQGSAGIYRLRTELIARLNSTIEEGIVKDILFGEIIVQ
jgi:flagellar FliL protein